MFSQNIYVSNLPSVFRYLEIGEIVLLSNDVRLVSTIEEFRRGGNSICTLVDAVTCAFRRCVDFNESSLESGNFQSFVDSTNHFIKRLLAELNFRYPGLRYRLMLNVLKDFFNVQQSDWRRRIQSLIGHPEFAGKSELVCEIVRRQIEVELSKVFRCELDRNVRRITRADMASVSQGAYVLHCLLMSSHRLDRMKLENSAVSGIL
jgi:hypothetical protein